MSGQGRNGQRGGRGLGGRVFDVLARLALGEPTVAPRPPDFVPEEPGELACDRLARFLAVELRLPLAALGRLGSRCASASDPDVAAIGRALARTSERLDVLVTNTLELGLIGEEPAERDRADASELVEKVVGGHRPLIEGLSMRVRVLDCTRQAEIRAGRLELLQCLAALFSDLLERVPRNGRVDLRLRELHGLVRIDCCAPDAAAASRPDRTTMLRAAAFVSRLGGELWELDSVGDGGRGFGLTLPRATRAGPLALIARRTANGRGRRPGEPSSPAVPGADGVERLRRDSGGAAPVSVELDPQCLRRVPPDS